MKVYVLIDKYVDYHDVFDDTQVSVFSTKEKAINELNKRWKEFLDERGTEGIQDENEHYKSWGNRDCYLDMYIRAENVL